MIEKLKAIKDKFDQLTQDIANPEIIADMKTWQAKVKEHAGLTELMEEYDKKMGSLSCSVPVLEQYVLTEFIRSGSFERHLNRMRRKMK